MKSLSTHGKNSRASTSAARGQQAEAAALDYLRREGHVLVARNFRCRMGEVDLVMQDHDCIVFVEVRYRSASQFASAALSVDNIKQSKIARTAEIFLGKHPAMADYPVRFDVVAFDGREKGPVRIQWLKDAFRV